MKTNIHFLSYLAQFFLEWEMLQTKVVEKIKTHILCSITFSRKSRRLWDNVEKHDRVGQATDGNMIEPMRIACCILKDSNTHTHREYVTLTAFPRQQWLRERASTLHYTYITYPAPK